jgi:arginine/lysine/ornithine decarboxylase
MPGRRSWAIGGIAYELTTRHGNASRVAQSEHQRKVNAILATCRRCHASAPSRPLSALAQTHRQVMRSAYYASYEESDWEYVDLTTARQLLDAGRPLVSTTFVVPYPPASRSWCPGS